MAARVKPASISVVVSAEALGPGSGGSLGPGPPVVWVAASLLAGSDVFSLTAPPCLSPLCIPLTLGGALPRGAAGDPDRGVWLDALGLEFPSELGPPGRPLAHRGIGVGVCKVVGVELCWGVGFAEGKRQGLVCGWGASEVAGGGGGRGGSSGLKGTGVGACG